jgi:hypothetical protein
MRLRGRSRTRPPFEYFVKCAKRDVAQRLAAAALRAGLRVAIVDQNGAHVNDNAKGTTTKTTVAMVCVGIGRRQLEQTAERQSLVKRVKQPSSITGYPYKLAFSRDAQHTPGGEFEGYASADFFSPCERIELLGSLVEDVIDNSLPSDFSGQNGRAMGNGVGNQNHEVGGWDHAHAPHGSLSERLKAGETCGGIMGYGPLHPVGGDYAARNSLTAKEVLRSAVVRMGDTLSFSLAAHDSSHSLAKLQAFYGR